MHQRPKGTLPRSARLRGHDAFGPLFREGEGLRRGELVVKYRVSNDPAAGDRSQIAPPESIQAPSVQAGFVVRRNAGSAVRRNRLRRLLREAYRVERQGFIDALPSGINLDMVVLWSGSPDQALRPSFGAIASSMQAALGALSSRLRKRADGIAEQR